MPQITIEYSSNLRDRFDGRALTLAVHDALVRTIATDPASCKTRLVEHQAVVIADGAATHAMLHADLRILSGRSAAQKTALGEAVIALLEQALRGRTDGLSVQATAEVRDLDRPNYHKILI